MKTAGRSQRTTSSLEYSAWPTKRSRSLASRIPSTSSRSSPITGKRECPDSMMIFSISSTGWSFSRTTIWERGIITSRTWVAETSSTPSSMACSSGSNMSPAWASLMMLRISSRPLGSPRSAFSRRLNRPGGSEPLLLGGLSSVMIPIEAAQIAPSWILYQCPWISILPVRVRIAQFREDLPLEAFHAGGLLRRLVVVAGQMQGAVDDHVAPVALRRLALLGRLPRHHRRTDHEVPQGVVRLVGQARLAGGERQHVGRAVLAAPAGVQLPAFGLADDAHHELPPVGIGARPAERRLSPAYERIPARDGRGILAGC